LKKLTKININKNKNFQNFQKKVSKNSKKNQKLTRINLTPSGQS